MDIKKVLNKYGLSQVNLAQSMFEAGNDGGAISDEDKEKKLKSITSYVSQLINGKSEPSIKKLDELAALIGCQRWEFFEDEIEAAGYSIVRNGLQPASTDNAEPVADDAAEQEQARQADTDVETKAEEARVLRFTYDCPHCGESVKISIEKA